MAAVIVDGPMIHEKAHVDSGCTFGDGTYVWQFASVIRKSQIGQHCSVGAGAVVDGAKIGDGCTIGSLAQLHPGTVLGKNVFVGPGVIFCNDLWPRVAKGGFDFNSLSDRPTAVVKDGASIGAGAIILPGVVIGEGAMVAAGCVVSRPLPSGYLLRRDGSVEPMPEDAGQSKRMQWAS